MSVTYDTPARVDDAPASASTPRELVCDALCLDDGGPDDSEPETGFVRGVLLGLVGWTVLVGSFLTCL